MAEYPIPPWLSGNPSATIPAMFAEGSGRGIQRDQANRSQQLEEQRMAMTSQMQAAQLAQSAQQQQTELALKQQQIALSKEQFDAEFQQRVQEHATETAMKKQEFDLATQTAATKFQAQRQIQKLIEGGMDADKAYLMLGAQAGIAGAGLAAFRKQELTPTWSDTKTDEQGREYQEESTTHLKRYAPTDQTGKESLAEKKLKATFIMNWIKENKLDPAEFKKSDEEQLKDAIAAWDAATGDTSDTTSGAGTGSPATSRFKIVQVGP